MFKELDDAELARMTDRAYREAARCYQELRAYGEHKRGDKVRDMLAAGSSDATMFWVALSDEQARRANPSPWVRNAIAGTLPASDKTGAVRA